MLFLVFQLDEDRYAIEAAQVVAVLPLVKAKAIPQSPAAVVGAFDYNGEPVPLIDLSHLALGRAALPRLSTRIVVVLYPSDDGQLRKLGLVAEHVVETIRRDPDDFASSGISNADAHYLGPVAADARGLLQWVRVERMLPESVRDLLFKQPVES
jgi:chemotaxis-related protein WspB